MALPLLTAVLSSIYTQEHSQLSVRIFCYQNATTYISSSLYNTLKTSYYIKKVKCTLVQALRLCTGCAARRGSRCIALIFLDHGIRRGEGSASRPVAIYPRERRGTHHTGGWVGPSAGLDR